MRLPRCPASSAQTTGTEVVTHLVFSALLSIKTFTGAATHVISKCMPHPALESVRWAQTREPSVVIANASEA